MCRIWGTTAVAKIEDPGVTSNGKDKCHGV